MRFLIPFCRIFEQMSRRKNFLVRILILAFASGSCGSLWAQNGAEIIDRHIAAMGGIDNWNKIKTMVITSSAKTPTNDITLVQTISAGKGMRMDIRYMGISGYTIVTPTDGWVYTPFGQGMDRVTKMQPSEVKASQEKLDVKNGLLLDKSIIAKAEYIGSDSVNTMLCYKVKVTDKAGNVQTAFFDAATYYMVRVEVKIRSADMDQDIFINYSNFEKQSLGIVYPMALSSQEGDFTVKAVELNKPVDENIFKPNPADLKK
jgi:hypothetical protein